MGAHTGQHSPHYLVPPARKGIPDIDAPKVTTKKELDAFYKDAMKAK